MAMITTVQFKQGLKLIIDGQPCNIIKHEHVRPGKGQAFHKVKIKNLQTGRVIERTYKSGESAETADVEETDMQFLYCDGEHWHFMDPKSYEQLTGDKVTVGEAGQWIKEEDMCTVVLWNGALLTVEAPNFVELVITETDPGEKGDTASGGTKPAKLETGAFVKVPLFVQQGEKVKVDTRTGEYVSRAK